MNSLHYPALSLWQPWALLIVLGLKVFETRSWQRRSLIGQTIAIHAASKWDWQIRGHMMNLAVHPLLRPHLLDFGNRPIKPALGAVVCLCKVVEIYPTEAVQPSELERAVGDWSPGRFAWKLERVETFDPPIPAVGRQKLWTWGRPSA